MSVVVKYETLNGNVRSKAFDTWAEAQAFADKKDEDTSTQWVDVEERDGHTEATTLPCGCVVSHRRTEKMCGHHQAEDDAIYQENERRRQYRPLPVADRS